MPAATAISNQYSPASKRPKTKLVFSKKAFFDDIGYFPRPEQEEIHKDKSPIRVVACGVRFGKSKLAAMEALAEGMKPRQRCWGWVIAPVYELADKVFREILYIARTKLKEFIIDASDSRMKLKIYNAGGGITEIQGKSADNPDSLLGEGLHFAVLDECSRMKPGIWESYVSQRLLDNHGWAILISTPKGKNWFYKHYLKGRDNLYTGQVKSWNYPTHTNPLIDPALLATMKNEMSDLAYRQEIMAEFIDSGGVVFRNIMECATSQLMVPSPTQEYVIGVDLAKYRDFTVQCVMDTRGSVVGWERFNQIDWTIQKQRVKDLSDRYNKARILVDSTGVGDPIHEDLVRMGLSVLPYQFTEASKKALIDNLIVQIEGRHISYPPIPELLDELSAYTYELTDAGRLKRGAPSGYHDDCVTALALAAWAHKVPIGMDIESW